MTLFKIRDLLSLHSRFVANCARIKQFIDGFSWIDGILCSQTYFGAPCRARQVFVVSFIIILLCSFHWLFRSFHRLFWSFHKKLSALNFLSVYGVVENGAGSPSWKTSRNGQKMFACSADLTISARSLFTVSPNVSVNLRIMQSRWACSVHKLECSMEHKIIGWNCLFVINSFIPKITRMFHHRNAFCVPWILTMLGALETPPIWHQKLVKIIKRCKIVSDYSIFRSTVVIRCLNIIFRRFMHPCGTLASVWKHPHFPVTRWNHVKIDHVKSTRNRVF